MLSEISATNGKPYPIRLILKVGGLSSAAWYDIRRRKSSDEKLRRGQKPQVNDIELLREIKVELEHPIFHGEGYIKIRKRLNKRGIRVGKTRLYRIMSQNDLLCNKRSTPGGGRLHDGKIITDQPNRMWASDGKEFHTQKDGKCWFIGIIDHFNDEIISFFVTKTFDRFAAIEPLRMAVKKIYGSVEQNTCDEMHIALRCDHGSQFDSKDYQNELKFFGIEHSPAFVRSPQCNGIIERFHRTLNEQIFKIDTFDNIEEANNQISMFVEKYNKNWILHRLKLKSPVEYRMEYYNQAKP